MNNNLVELIGIIEGINYDGVINGLEILKLNEWLSQNRQYKKDPFFNKTIVMLEKILEDNIITLQEKDELIEYAHMYYQDNHNVNDSLTILNGIVEGIICDQVINKEEIEELNRWLSSNRFLEGNKTYDKILELIERVLEDNILTKEEQKELFELFENEVFDSKTDIKLNFLKKKVRSRKNIGVELIELINDDKMISRIHNAALVQLKRALMSYSGTASIDNELVFISLVLIALLDYDVNFYEHVEETYPELYEMYSPQKINGQIRSIISRYRRGSGDNAQRIINYLLMNSIVPKKFLPNFFEFMFNVYKINFNYSLDENIFEDFKFIYEGLKGSLNHETDELSLNATKKTYKLIRSTKSLVLLEHGIDEIINLSVNVIKLIDKHYWDDEAPVVSNIYYKYGYDKWVAANERREKLKKSRGERRNSFTQRWEPTFKIKGENIIMVPPAHRINNSYDYSKIAIFVYNGDEVIYKNTRPNIHEIIGGYQVLLEEINIVKPLGKLQYVIKEDENIIYDSKESLYREFIMFNTKGYELKNNTNYVGDVFICHCCDNIEDILNYKEMPYYRLGYASVNEDSAFAIGHTLVNFVSEMKPGIMADKIPEVSLENVNFKIPVYKSLRFLVFESMIPIEDIGIKINENRKNLSDFRFEIHKKDLYNHYIVELNIDESDIYDILAYQKSTNKGLPKTRFIFAIDNELKFEKQKLDDDNYIVDIKSSFNNVDGSYDLVVSDFDKFRIPVRLNGKEYNYVLPLKIPMYRIDNDIWMNFDLYIWIDDINSQSMIYFNGIKATELLICDSNNKVLGSTGINCKGNYLTC